MTERVGLLGWPVEHSLSPAMHHAAFVALGLDWTYELVPVRPDQLVETVIRLVADGWRGMNITVPHKQAVLTDLASLVEPDRAASKIGAANTLIARPDGTLFATNTDWRGFAEDVRAQVGEVTGWDCLVLGTGGAARAVAYALEQMAARSITFASRAPEKSALGPAVAYPDLVGRVFDLIVNTTPVGMWPQTDVSPWPDDLPFPTQAVVYDAIYNPPVTQFMAQAQAAGLRTIGGLGMLVRQGAYAFEHWTGIFPPLEVMVQAAQTALKTRLGGSST